MARSAGKIVVLDAWREFGGKTGKCWALMKRRRSRRT
jgi:hypothetical protein